MVNFARRIGWPLFALAVAFALWITFIASPEMVTTVTAPVAYKNMPEELVPTTELPTHVSLELRGPSARLRHVDTSAAVTLDLDDVRGPGEHTITIGRRQIDVPAGLTAVRWTPAQIRIPFEWRRQAQVPVKVRFSTPPPAGYRVAGQRVEPASLKIEGPESHVRRVAFVETDPIDISRVVVKQQFQVDTFLGDPQVRFVSSPVVRVSVTLEKVGGDGKAAVRN
ncbi:MAG: YbbR-like domain-containing protein [Acidobacteriota bacterium]